MVTILQHNKYGTLNQQIPQRRESCNKFYSRGRNRVRIGLKHGKKPYPLKRILGMALYKSEHRMNNYLEPESYCIEIESCCFYSIASKRKEFIGEMTPCNIKIQGIT